MNLILASSQGRFLNRLLSLIKNIFVFSTVWIPTALAILMFKLSIMNASGFLVSARTLGYATQDFGLMGNLSFFANDLVVLFLVIPIALYLITRVLPVRLRTLMATIFTLICALWGFANMQSMGNVGRYISLDMLKDAFAWGISNPDQIRAYIEPKGAIKLVTLIVVTCLAGVIIHRVVTKRRARNRVAEWIHITSVVTSSTAGILGLILLLYPLKATSHHEALLITAARSFFLTAEIDTQFTGLSMHDLSKQFVRMTNTPDYQRDLHYFGKAANFDVIFFIFETGPHRVLSIEDNLDDLPNLRALREHSLVPINHFTTYPYTSDALFSVFSSWYPVFRRELMRSKEALIIPGLLQQLKAKNYEIGLYAPERGRFEADERMFKMLGTTQQFYAEGLDPPVHATTALKLHLIKDNYVFSEMLRNIDDWTSIDHRYATIFLPQTGHGPWPAEALPNGGSILQRGRALIRMQDAWLGELVKLLKKKGKLDKTLIVVTADHGIRTRQEDPELPTGMIDAYSFHVPLLIFGASLFATPTYITQMSSHIDVTPSIMDLLGMDVNSLPMQGRPLWNARLDERKMYFFAKDYFGADGMVQNNRYAMCNNITNACFLNSTMHFNQIDPLSNDRSEAQTIAADLRSIQSLLYRWTLQGVQPGLN